MKLTINTIYSEVKEAEAAQDEMSRKLFDDEDKYDIEATEDLGRNSYLLSPDEINQAQLAKRSFLGNGLTES